MKTEYSSFKAVPHSAVTRELVTSDGYETAQFMERLANFLKKNVNTAWKLFDRGDSWCLKSGDVAYHYAYGYIHAWFDRGRYEEELEVRRIAAE